jgi:N-acetylglucosamine kinase-like BadF-type ATPase
MLFLGIDGGQSSTTALIGDDTGRILGCGRGGPCNHVSSDEARVKFTLAIRDCLNAACAQAGIDPEQVRFAAACLGLSGGVEDKEAILRDILRVEKMMLTIDAVIALSGATAGEPGIITIAGTGSIAFGRNAAGKTARAGGWGHLFGDEGGGFDLARQALRAALRHEEGWGPPTALYPMLLEATAAASADNLLHRIYTTEISRQKVASLAALVDRAAVAGDAVARDILHAAAQELATLTASVRGQLFETGNTVKVAYIGGVFRSGFLLERYRMLVELEEGNVCGPPIFGPAAGALIEAYRVTGREPALTNLPKEEK